MARKAWLHLKNCFELHLQMRIKPDFLALRLLQTVLMFQKSWKMVCLNLKNQRKMPMPVNKNLEFLKIQSVEFSTQFLMSARKPNILLKPKKLNILAQQTNFVKDTKKSMLKINCIFSYIFNAEKMQFLK